MSRSDRPSIALYTYGVAPRGGVVHAIEVGEALFRAAADVAVVGIGDRGVGFFRVPACPHRIIEVEPKVEEIADFVKRRIVAYAAAIEAAPAADVHHAQDGISANALATLVERGVIGGFVRTVHHLDTFADPVVAALQERSIRAASQIYTVSRLWQDRLARDYGIVAQLVPNGVDGTRFVPMRAPRESAPMFLAVGGIERRKNTIATLEAFALVRHARPDATLVIAGGASIFDHSPYRAAFAARARELDLDLATDLRIRILGSVSDAALTELMREASALVFPSLIEGFGLVVLEALSCETPAIVSRIAPFTEYLTDRDAFLVDPTDVHAIAKAMLAALDPEQTVSMKRSGAAVASHFNWDASAEVHVALYRSFLAQQREVQHA